MDLLFDLVLNPLIVNGKFKEEYVESEKNNIKLLIESKIDNKAQYALNRCIEEMYKDKPYGLYKYGYIEDLDNINAQNLYDYYTKLINQSKIDIFVSGELKKDKVLELVKNNKNIEKLQEREAKYIINNEQTEQKDEISEKIVEEKLDVAQGKLVIGLDIGLNDYNSKFKVSIYNVILGESATSKLFQNVREKASLAYTAGSNYVRQKNNIYIILGTSALMVMESVNYMFILKIKIVLVLS